MATSGSVNYTQTRNDIILEAFQHIGAYGVGRTVSSADMSFASSVLNKMVKSWATKGLHLWTKEECILFVTKNEAAYSLGSTANCCLASDAVITTLSTAANSGATALTVTSTVGMTVGDYIGVVVSDNSCVFTTIATIPTSTTLTIASGLPSAAAILAPVYTYTTKITKPLRILSCRRAYGIDSGNTSTLTEIIMESISYEDYMSLPSKSISGLSNQFHYNPQLNSGAIYLWQRPNDCRYRIHFTAERMIEDLDNPGDNFDFPNEWLEPLTWQLALRLCPAFGKDQRMQASIAPMAQAMLDNLLDWDAEITSINIQPDTQ